jgi:hypothetical protein
MHLGGKIAEVAEDSSAFRHRTAPLETHAIISWRDKADTKASAAAAQVAANFGKVPISVALVFVN